METKAHIEKCIASKIIHLQNLSISRKENPQKSSVFTKAARQTGSRVKLGARILTKDYTRDE